MTSLRDLQKSLSLKLEEVRQRDSLIHKLEREVQARDRQIRAMQAELDKFKQILKPMTQQLAQNLTIQGRGRKRARSTGNIVEEHWNGLKYRVCRIFA